MSTQEEKIQETIHVLLYIIHKVGGQADFHKIFKILYFADKKHLANFGRFISGDKYIAMKDGPVPSIAYDILKALREEGFLSNFKKEMESYFELMSDYKVKAKREPDLDELSQSEIDCINESIEKNAELKFSRLKNKSHDSAWKKVIRDCEMNIKDIAEAEGANKYMIEYINEKIENQNADFE
ncbi:MAG: Panacea domain-containing protein [Bacteroidales bacterium]|nr:SocA family protein [Bacteroidales bacterium]MBS3777361.1 SocA family protein [Bacteroidales bacterium]